MVSVIITVPPASTTAARIKQLQMAVAKRYPAQDHSPKTLLTLATVYGLGFLGQLYKVPVDNDQVAVDLKVQNYAAPTHDPNGPPLFTGGQCRD